MNKFVHLLTGIIIFLTTVCHDSKETIYQFIKAFECLRIVERKI